MKTLALLKTTAIAVATMNLVFPLQWVMAETPTVPVQGR